MCTATLCNLCYIVVCCELLVYFSDKKSCNTSTTLQNSVEQFVSDSWASCLYCNWQCFRHCGVQWIGLNVGRNTHGHRGLDWIGPVSYSGLGWIGFSKMDPCPTLLWTSLFFKYYRRRYLNCWSFEVVGYKKQKPKSYSLLKQPYDDADDCKWLCALHVELWRGISREGLCHIDWSGTANWSERFDHFGWSILSLPQIAPITFGNAPNELIVCDSCTRGKVR